MREDGWYRLRKSARSRDETIVLIIFGRVIHAHAVHWGGPYHFSPTPSPTFIISEPPGEELEDWLWEKMPMPVERRSYVLAQGASGDPPAARYGNFVFWFIIGVLVSAMAAIQVLGR